MPHILILGGDGYLGWPTARKAEPFREIQISKHEIRNKSE